MKFSLIFRTDIIPYVVGVGVWHHVQGSGRTVRAEGALWAVPYSVKGLKRMRGSNQNRDDPSHGKQQFIGEVLLTSAPDGA